MIKVGIVGANGYTGLELLRLLVWHPEVSLHVITSRSEAGKKASDVFTNLRGHTDLYFQKPDTDLLMACDVVFFATPHTVSMTMVPALIDYGIRVIDLSADFRLKDIPLWEHWYNTAHTSPKLVKQAIYGLPEVNRDKIKSAQLVASPGCYPTASLLGFLPLLENNIIDRKNLIIDAKSGISGAGRKAIMNLLLAESSENVNAYAVATGHRHHPEIEQGLTTVAGQKVALTFVPHLVPMIRGIHATLYSKIVMPTDLQTLFEQRYEGEPYVDVMPAGSYPETRSVRGANSCRIAVHQVPDSDTVVVLSVIDNLVKGAAGQAIQAMNIMFGFDESTAIKIIAIQP